MKDCSKFHHLECPIQSTMKTAETMREKRKGRMMERLLVASLLSTMVTKASAQNAYNPRAEECEAGGPIGYKRIEDMNTDIQEERLRVLGGAPEPEGGYIFGLCPNLAYDASTPIRPDLDNILIACLNPAAEAPLSEGSCVLFGGQDQVEVSSFSDTDYPVTSVTIDGITFSEFDGAAVSGVNANVQTTVVLDDVIFSASDNPGSFLVRQTNGIETLAPFDLEVKDSVVDGATVSEGFMNEGGNLAIDGLTVRDSTMGVLVSATAGTVIIDDMAVQDSDIGNVVSLEGGANGRIDKMSVSSITGITEIVAVNGPNTGVIISNSNVAAIPAPESVDLSWTGYFANNGATMTVRDSTFENTQGFRNLVYSEGASTTTVERVDFLKVNSGLQTEERPASVMQASSDSTLNLKDSLVQEVDGVTSVVIVAFNSNLDASGNCFDRTFAGIVVLVTKDSDYTATNNAIENMNSGRCQDSGVGGGEGSGRLGKETPTGECLEGGTCTVACEPFAQYETCEEIIQTTFPPSSAPTTVTSAPTVRQSDAPSSVPTNTPAPTPETFPPTTLTRLPTFAPTSGPTIGPTEVPTIAPTIENDTLGPTADTDPPTLSPDATGVPTSRPTPMIIPEETPVPTSAPSGVPSQLPTIQQTESPTTETHSPTTLTRFPTTQPTSVPTAIPTSVPTTSAPTTETWAPTKTQRPTSKPTQTPSASPSSAPTTLEPTSVPTTTPTLSPTSGPTAHPTLSPVNPPSAAPTRCIPRPIYVSARNPMDSSSSKNGKGKSSRHLKMHTKGKGYSSKGKGYSYKGKGYSSKGKGYSSKGKGYSSKGKGYSSKGKGYSKGHEDPDLPYCKDVFKPIIISKGKGKGKGKGTRALVAPTKYHTPKNLPR